MQVTDKTSILEPGSAGIAFTQGWGYWFLSNFPPRLPTVGFSDSLLHISTYRHCFPPWALRNEESGVAFLLDGALMLKGILCGEEKALAGCGEALGILFRHRGKAFHARQQGESVSGVSGSIGVRQRG